MSPLQSLLFTFAQQDPTTAGSDAAATGAAVAGAGVGLVMMLVYFAVIVFCLFCMFKIAQKLGDENAWWAFVPILNVIQLAKLAGKEMWWGIVMVLCAPVGLVMMIICYGTIAEKLGKPAIVGYLTPFFYPIALGYLAFGSTDPGTTRGRRDE